MRGRVLVIAGSDSGGGAGIQADIKTITMLGGYAATAITAITVQNTLGVSAIHPVPIAIITQQICAVLDDIGADCIKIGMLGDEQTIHAVADCLQHKAPGIPMVLDPVMIAKGGAALLPPAAIDALIGAMVPKAHLITPNAPELAALVGQEIENAADMETAARRFARQSGCAVLAKGGHLPGDDLVDLLVDGDKARFFRARRIKSRHTHGTGCTLASAIATGLAQGMALDDAISRAHGYVQGAILKAPGYGAGHGPLNHSYRLD
ncbi:MULTISPECIES: bifunctional hydroxymethylpyrimidine kinase/phosphomethylpyrimidine kinase [unclassified Iodidimonas]|jgi:hydroxymethylpyrimidine/phosphomethylpyrimidine kinase|uniref:bifunctional hydroxymethylpyrimidine kinase/phosphomethylpyrimidine kinase n=1 Tax=unclassified Iodidimonas TaxID=2626145 RepID=UPI00248271AB|nr:MULTISPECIES: bifunctional hydroxymethylpyrimidine kinase/phosphomethylpyrimidine kinase [unclassified Iodidimonas]